MSSPRRSTTYRPTRSVQRHRGSRKDVYEKSLCVEKKHIGYLIGPKGSVIKGLQQKHGIRARIVQDKCMYLLSGPQQNVLDAVQEIQQHIAWINNVTVKREQTKTSKEESDDDGWTSAGPRRRSKNQPRHVVEDTTSTEFRSDNSFAGLDSDSDSDEETDVSSTGKYNGDTPTFDNVFKPTGCWGEGPSAEVKEEGVMKLSRDILEHRLADAEIELIDAEAKLKYYMGNKTSSSWADAADIEDSEEDVDYWKGVIVDLQKAIRDY